MPTSPRYAIYFAPAPASALWRFGSSVLGYDAATGQEVEQWLPAGIDAATWRELTAEPRRYGFHATLKAPFRLVDGASEADLLDALARFAASAKPFDLALDVTSLDGFIALMPSSPPATVAALEDAVVATFDRFRARLTEADRSRRLRAPLTRRQIEYLDRYGYPYVHEEFRFHMTLTGRLPPEVMASVKPALRGGFETRGTASVALDRLAVFREEEGHFRIVSNLSFG